MRFRNLLFITILLFPSSISCVYADNSSPHEQGAEEAAETCIPTISLDSLSKNHTLPKMELVHTVNLDNDVTGIAWSHNSKLFATSERMDTIVKVWNLSNSHLLRTINKENSGNNRLLFTQNDDSLITTSLQAFDGVNKEALAIVDTVSGKVVHTIEGPYDPSHFARANAPLDFSLSPDGQKLYIRYPSRDGNIYVYTTKTWSEISSLQARGTRMVGGPKSDQVIVAIAQAKAETINIWNGLNKQLVRVFPIGDARDAPGNMALNQATCRLASGIALRMANCVANCEGRVGLEVTVESSNDPYSIRIWDVNTGKQLTDGFGSKDQKVESLDFSPDGNWLAAVHGSNDHAIILYNSSNPMLSTNIYNFQNYAWSVAFSPDGHFLAIAGDSKVLIFQIR